MARRDYFYTLYIGNRIYKHVKLLSLSTDSDNSLEFELSSGRYLRCSGTFHFVEEDPNHTGEYL